MQFGELEGTGFDVIDPAFGACFVGSARVERLWTGSRWAEGPAWFAAGRYLVWSDIPNDRMLRWDETNGVVSVFRQPAGNTNGHTVDREGRLVSCEHLARRVTRTEHDGTVTVLADAFEGKRLNSPNDVVVKSDGSIWFTDPDYGILSDYEGLRADSELSCNVYRIGTDGALAVVTRDMVKPNGIAFSPDESILYVSDTGASHVPDGPRHIRTFPLNGAGEVVGDSSVFATCSAGLFDGFRVDTDGRVWASTAEGVHCFATDGTLIGRIRIPEGVANLTFGGAKRNRLFICATTSLYSVFVTATGSTLG